MRWGLRVQLLVLLAVLLILSYLPLAFAVATYTRVGLEQLQQDNALKLGRSVATHLALQRSRTDPDEFLELARRQITQDSVHALTLYDVGGVPSVSLGDPELLAPLQHQRLSDSARQVRTISTKLGPALLIIEPSPVGNVGATIRYDAEITGSAQLTRLLGLYLGISALALIATLYFALTRLIVRPILDLEAAADRVAAGARHLLLPKRAPREVTQLGHRLAQMTHRLLEEERQLRLKVQEIEAKTVELNQAQGSLVRSERLATVGRLAAGLAHEVGNPISALMGLQDLMLSGGLTSEEERDFLLRMRKETARIDRVIADLLAYARPSVDRSTGALIVAGSVRQAVMDVIGLLRPQKSFQDLSVQADLHTGPDAVSLSQQELTQILMNLVMNAADACEQKGRILIKSYVAPDEESQAEQRDATQRATDELSDLWLSVDDTGPGIPPKIKDSLFEPFVTTKDVGKGTGLGLSVTKGLVEAAGGTIVVCESELGGARFVMRLPRKGARAAAI